VPDWLVALTLLAVVVVAGVVATAAMDLRGKRDDDTPRRMPIRLAADPARRGAGAVVVTAAPSHGGGRRRRSRRPLLFGA